MNIGLLFGGNSYEHEVSLKSASFILHSLVKGGHSPYVIAVTKKNQWYLTNTQQQIDRSQKGLPLLVDEINLSQENIIWPLPGRGLWMGQNNLQQLPIDCAFIMMHGNYGEDGTIQAMLYAAKVPFTGSDFRASMICMNKHITKSMLEHTAVPFMPYKVFSSHMQNNYKDTDFQFPQIVKPSDGGSSVGVYAVYSARELKDAIANCKKYSNIILIEPFLEHVREIEVAIIGKSEDPIVLDPGEVVIPNGGVYTYDKKYHDTTHAIHCDIPAQINADAFNSIKEYARTVYLTMGCNGFARVDFFLTKNNEIFFNEINTIPGCTSDSLFPKACLSMYSPAELVSAIIAYAL